MKRRQLENRILFFIAFIIVLILWYVSDNTASLFFSTILILPTHRNLKNLKLTQPLPTELHNQVKKCVAGDYSNNYGLIPAELIPVRELIEMFFNGLQLTDPDILIEEQNHYLLYPTDLIKVIKEMPPQRKPKDYNQWKGIPNKHNIGKLLDYVYIDS